MQAKPDVMSPVSLLILVFSYFGLLFLITWISSRKASNFTFFLGNRKSPWFVVAFGMIGASLSGVTFMSVPGWVGASQFSYMIMVLGYLLGYTVIALVLMPMYYKLNLTSIYSYLETRFGFWSYKTGSFFFLLSRTIGASFRMYIVINVLQLFIFDKLSVPFVFTVILFLVLVIVYTFQGGIKTIVWTDTLQTIFMLMAVGMSIFFISKDLNLSLGNLIQRVSESEMSDMLFAGWMDKRNFIKQFLSGAFIAIAMTGLDQEMMQKNLSCRNIKDAQKNMFSFSIILVFVNLMFLFLGAILFIYAAEKGIHVPPTTDDLFPTIALNYLGPIAGLVFMIGLISAAFPSADGALTSLTTIFCIDFLNFNKRTEMDERKKKRIRYLVHFSFAAVLLLVIVLFKAINNQAVINKLFTIAGYTYGPLLGLYAFGLFSKRPVADRFVPLVALLSPVLCYIINILLPMFFNGFTLGFELLLLNGFLTCIGLWVLSKKQIRRD